MLSLNMEKGWRKKFDEVKDKIMDGHRRGVCNTDGYSVKRNGVYIPKPRVYRATEYLCNKCMKWHKAGESCGN